MLEITFEQVFKSYNGKSGCMCGCNGNYSLPTHTDIDAANKEIGYEGYDQSDVSDRRVKIAVRKVNQALEQYNGMDEEDLKRDGINVGIDKEHGNAWIEQGGRSTVVYFTEPK